jgi:4-hydroxy-tetrahydrodipicolinate synthase
VQHVHAVADNMNEPAHQSRLIHVYKEAYMSIFKGAGVAIVTPMKADLEVNYDKLEELIEWQIAEGTDCIVIAGTTGESSTLTTEEHARVIKAAVDFTKHRIPVVAGTGSNCTREAVHLSVEAQKAGVDGLLCVTPYYNKATQGGLIRYYTEIADAVKLPIIMYNVPGRTGCNILPETAATLYRDVENIVAIKEATGNVAQAAKTMYLTDGKLDMYSGEDGIVTPLMAIGAIGVISVWSNIAPRDVHQMCMDYRNGNGKAAMELQLKAQPLVEALFSEVNPIPVKAALNLMGKEVGSLRSPLTEMTDAGKARLAQAMKDYGLKLA